MISGAEKISILAGLMGTALYRHQTLSESATFLGIRVMVLCLAPIAIAFVYAAVSFALSRPNRLALWAIILLIVATAVEVIIEMLPFIISAGFDGTGPWPILASILCFAAILQIWLISGVPRKLLTKE